ncbi:MAG: hypothetical protein AMXMBFR83_10700, partial [Phycisphaerae bacterium]
TPCRPSPGTTGRSRCPTSS